MNLKAANTKWILFLAASHQPDQRHILDLAFGLLSLEKAGISPSDIFIYVDGTDRGNIAQWMSFGSTHQYAIKTAADFFVDQQQNAHENLVMFITGHGSIDGIAASPFIKPAKLVDCLKASPNLQRAVVYLAQCDAGIFNFMPIGKRAGNGSPDPDLIFVGATNLHSSISSTTQEDFVNGPFPWVANLFLLYVFKWLQSPVDVDGDGKMTIMDSYKYAGATSNQFNKWVKSTSFVECMRLHESYIAAEKAFKANQADPALKLALEGANSKYVAALDFHFIHQECWILNSWPAQTLEL